jgi:signal transduction histidine kinase
MNNLIIAIDKSISDSDRSVLETIRDGEFVTFEEIEEIEKLSESYNPMLVISNSDRKLANLRDMFRARYPELISRLILVSEYDQYKAIIGKDFQDCDDMLITPFDKIISAKIISNNVELIHLKSKLREDASIISSLNTERNELLSIAAHDLKNPIYSISMLAKVIKNESELSREEIEEFSSDIITTSQRMLALISNLLDISKIEQGRLKLKFEDIDVIEIIRAILEIYRERANAKGITLELDNEYQRLIISFDRNALFQILDNLISNAIKFSPFNRKVTVALIKSKNTVKIMVKDQGPGISEEEMPFLFAKFSRLSAMPSGDEDSTGLGLSIVKKYADMTRSRVSCISIPGTGSTFIVEIPFNSNN